MSFLKTNFAKRLPWVLGKKVRIPGIKFPEFQDLNMVLPTPGKSIILIAIYAGLFWLVMGGIYILTNNPIALGSNSNGQPVWLYPSTSDAFVIESIVAAIFIFLGGLGFIFLYETTKHSFNYSYAVKLLIFGLVLICTTFGLLQWMIQQKENGV